ncbi:hypothetical protein HDC94_000911 [Leifsonia sp. AK011]|uniref:hypothetical protein n=1 Tax=Leifsonia sp. AK011 TaxID=2723075 RepID=UPI0015CB1C4D|nr:hypothetical protein [Leifsonia sp. AK011]NYF09755.1 hypothetical protein [Leifsonia sp. AK011]
MTENTSRLMLPALVLAGVASGAVLAFIMQWVLSTGPDLAWRAGNERILDVTYVPPAQLIAVLAVGWGGFAALITYLVARTRTSMGGFVGAAIAGPWSLAVPLSVVLGVEAVIPFNPAFAQQDDPVLFGVVWAAASASLATVVFFVVLLRTGQKRRARPIDK